jgi:parallel beta-helix repeat protein
VINQPLTLKGVTFGTAGASVITVPGTGLVQNATTAQFGPVSGQLVVENTVGVTVSDITVDGAGGACAPGAKREVGIVFINIGAPVDGTSAGKVQNAVVRNINGCGFGEGILSDNSYMTILSNEIHNVDLSCVNVAGGHDSITSNSIQGCVNGIVANASTAPTAISQNSLSNLVFNGNAIWVNFGEATVTMNNIAASPGPLFYGLVLNGSTAGTIATGNKISGNGYGLVLFEAFGSTVQNNTVSNSLLGIYDTFSFGGNIVTKNTVNESGFGVFEFSPANDVFVPNNLYNVVTTVDPSEPTDPTAKGIAF